MTLSLEKLVEEYNEMLESNEYITYRKYNIFIDKYQAVFRNSKDKIIEEIANNGYTKINEHNEKITDYKMHIYKEYFDNMFKNIDESIKLDDEQRRAILNEEDYSLIIAGAGAGKTTTMSAKVKYLIEKKHIDPKKIAVISYTNKATEELEDRIKIDFNLPVNITLLE